MIDFKATLDQAKMSQSEFARLLGRPRQQINKWCLGVFKPSPLMEKMIIEICQSNNIRILS